MVIVGSLNKAKVEAIADTFENYLVEGIAVPSDVLAQPIGDYMTRQGAINRALYALEKGKGTIGIGLEGGVTFLGEECYVCNWGALVTQEGEVFTANGAGIQLPIFFKEELLKGVELGVLMEGYTKKLDVRTHEGAIGVFTDGLLMRKTMYQQLATLLKGQFYYNKKQV